MRGRGSDAGGTENFSYDKMGRELGEQRTTNGVTRSTSYAYNLDGSLASLTYPSGRVVTYSYDAAARPVSAVDSANSINYATGALYAPQGALAQVQNGANLVSTEIYNSRLQPCWIHATTGTSLPTSAACTGAATTGNILDLKYNFNLAAGDNGNVIGITNNRDTTRSQSFTYDQVNRLVTGQTSASTGSACWGESFTYDQWANLTTIGAVSGYAGCTQDNLSVGATANNQISATGVSYDSSGNVLTDGVNTYGWNAESQMKSAAGVNYTYDGDGNRVQKSNGKIYWYGAGSEILDESDLSGNFTSEYVFFGGKRVARRDVASGTIYYYAEDLLGSSRAIVQAGQTTPCYDADFTPFGTERVVTNTCPQNYKFEGKERDTETGNDDFGARYYSPRFGRWLSADWSAVPAPVPYANLANPQTLNLYAMVGDNPETFADLDGHCGQPGSTNQCHVEGGVSPADTAGQQQQQPQNEQPAQNNDPTAPPAPPTPDPAGVRTDPALNPSNSNSNSSTTSSPADQTQAPMESRGRQGGQGKGERGDTAKPDKPVKGVKPDPKRPGEWLQWDGHKGNWVPKPPGWKPDNVTKQVGIWATVGIVTYWVVSEGSRVLFPPRNLIPVP